ncbi:MAG: cell wall hydrolase [Oscillospiraceae bacterium]|jgi:N-acetylmuramoyl-L-alanine amidase|nr:cell wall hydrolase [Oscillospiraceae bacterium]MCI1991397.1 cell wall hydrolase [Oscillospiraceae bacterium]MCI2036252.1 cell wall hydrolase [Oscillospiraceae bacterium]
MPYSVRELLARLLMCEAGGEGNNGMYAVATVIVNRTNIPYGEFFRVSNGGDMRAVIQQPGQFTCMMESVGGSYNAQNVYNMDPQDIHYQIADWAIANNTLGAVANSLFYFNPFRPTCVQYFPPGGAGVYRTRVGQHCFYTPTQKYAQT